MMQEAKKIEALRRAFQDPPPDLDLTTRFPCPDPETLWEAASGALDVAERHRVVDHLAECPECTLAWRLASELRVEEDDAYATHTAEVVPITSSHAFPRPPASWRRVAVPLISAAAAVSMAVGIMFFHQGRQDAEVRTHVTRSAETTQAPESPDDGVVIPREDFVLEWTPTDGATYDVEVWVLSDGLRLLKEFNDLTEPRVEIPEAELAGIKPGTELDWELEVHLPTGDTKAEAFSSIVE
jgi:hypothetical protein